MIVQLLVLGGIGYLAHRTRPVPASFSSYYSSVGSAETPSQVRGSGVFGSLVGKVLSLGRRRVDPTVGFIDLLVAWLAKVEETGEYFLGVCGLWIPLIVLDTRLRESPQIGLLESQMEKQVKLGHQLKAAGEYRRAAEVYERAALAAEKEGDPFSAPELYDEAARSMRMAGDVDAYIRGTVRAAQLFQKKNRSVRAAGLYEKLGKHYKSSKNAGRREFELASQYFLAAQELYEAEDDGRAANLQLERLYLAVELGEYAQAADGFEQEAGRLIQKDGLLINQSQRLLLFACVCYVATGDVQLSSRKQREYERNFAWFGSSREGRLARLLVGAKSEAEENYDDPQAIVDRLVAEKEMLASMPNWFDSIWSKALGSILTVKPDIT